MINDRIVFQSFQNKQNFSDTILEQWLTVVESYVKGTESAGSNASSSIPYDSSSWLSLEHPGMTVEGLQGPATPMALHRGMLRNVCS